MTVIRPIYNRFTNIHSNNGILNSAQGVPSRMRVAPYKLLLRMTSGVNKEMATHPLDISQWVPTPAPLNTEKHGHRARFTGDNSVVERWEPEQDPYFCVCYTSRPLPPGQVWQTTILNTTTRWSVGGLVSGCVLCLLYYLVMSMYIYQ